jgi:hypothetical protein
MSEPLGAYDYPANRGPLDRMEYVRRRPDPFSVVAGCLAIVTTSAALFVLLVVVVERIVDGR